MARRRKRASLMPTLMIALSPLAFTMLPVSPGGPAFAVGEEAGTAAVKAPPPQPHATRLQNRVQGAPVIKIAARSARAKKPAADPPTEPETPAATAPAAAAPPSEPPDPKLQQTAAWTDQEVIAALATCTQVLSPISAEVEVLKPIRDGQCGTPAPVLLKRVAGMEVSPPVIVTCPLVVHIHQWATRTLDPLAVQMLGSHVRKIVTLSGYTCRNRIGTKDMKISEHAAANAVDVGAVETTDGQTVDILSNWGPTVRDQKTGASAKTAAAKNPTTTDQAGGGANAYRQASPPPNQGDADHPIKSATATVAMPDPVRRAFVHRLHDDACQSFGTVLGPDANEAHRNHLHLDLAARKHGAFCE